MNVNQCVDFTPVTAQMHGMQSAALPPLIRAPCSSNRCARHHRARMLLAAATVAPGTTQHLIMSRTLAGEARVVAPRQPLVAGRDGAGDLKGWAEREQGGGSGQSSRRKACGQGWQWPGCTRL